MFAASESTQPLARMAWPPFAEEACPHHFRASFPLISARRDSQTDQRGNGTRTGLLHDRGPMILDGALADTQIRGYVFAG